MAAAVGFVGGLLGGGGGVVGSLLGGGGGILGSLLGGAGGIVNSLAEKFGFGDVLQGATNLAGDLLQTGLGSIIDGLPIPDFLKDNAKDFVGATVGGFQKEVSCECQEAVNEQLGGAIKEEVDSITDMIMSNMREETDEASGSNGDGKGGSGNWLMILAKALGKAAGVHLDTMIEKGKEMGDMGSSKGKEGEFAEVQAEFQAASQMFKMYQESISTMLKSVGEGMSSVARKQ